MNKIKIQVGDKCRLINLKEDSAERIKKLTSKMYDPNNGEVFFNRFNAIKDDPEKIEQIEIIVDGLGKTEKIPTEYANCIVKILPFSKFRVFIQTRYLEVSYRKCNHLLTNVFSDFWIPKRK